MGKCVEGRDYMWLAAATGECAITHRYSTLSQLRLFLVTTETLRRSESQKAQKHPCLTVGPRMPCCGLWHYLLPCHLLLHKMLCQCPLYISLNYSSSYIQVNMSYMAIWSFGMLWAFGHFQDQLTKVSVDNSW